MGVRRLLVTDLDGTLTGDDAALERFAAWRAAHRDDVRLAYATGRSLDGIEDLVREAGLPRPDVSIIQVGTEVYDASGLPWPGWDEHFDGWDAEVARAALAGVPGLTLQPPPFQTPRKASFYATALTTEALGRIGDRVRAAGLPVRIVYSGGRYLDVLPPGAGKGPAAAAVAAALGVGPDDVLVAGDTGNDVDLFRQGFRGTVVANALPELTDAAGDAYRSPLPHAAGVLDGVRHWWGAEALQPVRLEEAAERVGHL
jgi:sucrose-6F-phosphate phosphohydrolase